MYLIPERSYGLYVHIPFCLSKCPYCSFNSYPISSLNINESQYIESICKELEFFHLFHAFQANQIVTIFFGGGTPSLLDPEKLGLFFLRLKNTIPNINIDNLEITLEANPGNANARLNVEKLKDFRSIGFNRISFGIQSFDDRKLKKLGRLHSVNDAVTALMNARLAGFDDINIDLIYGISGETIDNWLDDIKFAIELLPTHISAYNLTREENTEFDKRVKLGEPLFARDDESSEMFLEGTELMRSFGYGQYEVSNYALDGYLCQHNLGYWSERNYLGIGAGAHSFIKIKNENEICGIVPLMSKRCLVGKHTSFLNQLRFRWWNVKDPSVYSNHIAKLLHAIDSSECISDVDYITEFIFLNLRTCRGMNLNKFEELFRYRLELRHSKTIEQLIINDLVIVDNNLHHLSLTKRGLLLLDEITAELSIV